MKPIEFLKTKSDHEASMARTELMQIAKNSMNLLKIIEEGDNLDGWVSAYITLANDYMNSVHDHLEYHSLSENASVGATASGAIASSMGNGNGFVNGGPGTITRTQTKKKRTK
jgi:hypothetical protein